MAGRPSPFPVGAYFAEFGGISLETAFPPRGTRGEDHAIGRYLYGVSDDPGRSAADLEGRIPHPPPHVCSSLVEFRGIQRKLL